MIYKIERPDLSKINRNKAELKKFGFLISEREGKRVYYYTINKVDGLF